MQDVTLEQVNIFKSSNQKNLILEFEDGTTIDNNSICTESMELEQTLCDEETLVYGKCSANSFKVQVKASSVRYKEKKFKAKIVCEDEELKLGTFTVYSDKINDDGIYRELICYDDMFSISDIDISNWYNGLLFPMTMYDFRNSLINYLGWEQEEQTLCNDSMIIEKNINVIQLSAINALEYICELNACFGKIDCNGKFKYVELDDVREALYPSKEIFPNEDLFPRTNASDTLSLDDLATQSFSYEEYTCMPVTQVKIRETVDDLGTTVGTEGNLYTIESNILCYGKSSNELEIIANNFLNVASLVWYQPFDLLGKGRPWLDVGDFIKVIGNKNIIRSVILHRRLTGISALKDRYSSQGLEYYPLNTSSIHQQIEQLKSASVSISKTVNKMGETLSTKVSKDNVVSEINQSAEEIQIQADKVNLKGAVTFETLDESLAGWADANDHTKINGGAVATNSVTSKQIDVEDLFAQNIQATGKITGAEFNTGNGTFQVDKDGKLTTKNISILGGSLSITADSASRDIIYIKFINSAGNIFETKITPIGISTYKDGVQNATINGMFGSINSKNLSKDGKDVVVTNDGGIKSFQNQGTYLEIATTDGMKGINWWNSDTRLKKNIEDTEIDNALEVVDQFKHHKFDWKNESLKSVKLGYLAHELQELDEDLVFAVKQNKDSEFDELLQIDETHLIPYLSKAIQELHSIVREQQNEIESINKLLNKEDT